MNKLRRNELKRLHFVRRLKNLRISKEELLNPNNNFHSFKSHGKPCSCWCCSPLDSKYNRAKWNTEKDKILMQQYEIPN